MEREYLIKLLNDYFCVGDSDTYICTRDKSAFSVGTMSLDDFEEISEENTSDLADYILKHLGEKICSK